MTLRWKPIAVAALLVAPVISIGGGAALAMPGPPASEADMARATELFKKANDLFKAKKFAPALEAFRQSHQLVPSPNSRLYIARCLAATGDYRSAWLEFDRTADDAATGGAKYAQTHDSAIQERDDLSSKVALVTVVLQNPDPGTTVRVGTVDVPPDRWGKPFPVDPGNADVIIQAPGKSAFKQTGNIAKGERRDIRPETAVPAGPVPGPGVPGGPATGGPEGPGGGPPPPSRPINGLRIGAFIAAGVGVAGFIMLGVEGANSKSTYNQLNTLCNGMAGCPGGNRAMADQLISTGKSQQAIANAGLGIGIVGLAAGATLFVLSMRKPAPSDTAHEGGDPHTPAPQATADMVVGPGWLGARGSF